jgi:ribosomal protein S18 acetylase RimI-like enzyme
MQIRKYQTDDEKGWVRCRTLSFLETAYFDNVLQFKESYDNPAIELVAVMNNQVVGLIDTECESEPKTVCTGDKCLGGMIWHVAVHPDYQRMGIGEMLLHETECIAKERGLDYLEAWTRDDQWVMDWYEKNKFIKGYTYLHVYIDKREELKPVNADLQLIQGFAHYTGDKMDEIKASYHRTHDCSCFRKII